MIELVIVLFVINILIAMSVGNVHAIIGWLLALLYFIIIQNMKKN